MIHTCISPSRPISLTNERMHTHPTQTQTQSGKRDKEKIPNNYNVNHSVLK